jgi:formylglycine-generating enzyme required for sulfatase activity
MATVDRNTLLDLLDRDFNADEVRELVFRLGGVDWDNLPGETKRVKLRELILLCERQGRLDALVATAVALRPAWAADAELTKAAPVPTPPVPAGRRSRIAASVVALVGVLIATVVLAVLLRPGQGATAPSSPVTPAAAVAACPAGPVRPAEEYGRMVTMTLASPVIGRDDATDVERPAHQVPLAPFAIDRFEVTNLQYQQFVRATGHPAPADWNGDQFPEGQAFFPIVRVTWRDALAYCQHLGKTLPTEAQWEAACRGGDARVYPWGSTYELGRANTAESQCNAPLAAGSYSPGGDTPGGASDMIGNVGEWVSSSFAGYPYAADARESTPAAGDSKVYRGGSHAEAFTCSTRADAPADTASADIGFRCVAAVAAP